MVKECILPLLAGGLLFLTAASCVTEAASGSKSASSFTASNRPDQADDQTSTLVIRAGHLVDPESESSQTGQSILIRGGKIEAIGVDVEVPKGATVLDYSKSWVLPGLFDAHTHLCAEMSARWHVEEFLVYSLAEQAPFRAIRGVVNAREMLEAGFTSVRDMGNAGDYADTQLVRAIDTHLIPGPSVIAAGRIIAPFGGQFRWRTRPDVLNDPEYYFADSKDEMRKAVRENVYYGARVIKVAVDSQPYGYSVDDLRFIVEEARNAGVRVAAHCQTQQGARRAAEAGVASIEHGWTLDDSDFELIRRNGVILVTTDFPVHVLEATLLDKTAAVKFHKKLVDRLHRAYAAGVEIAFGSDVMTAVPHQTRGTASLSYLSSFVEAGIPARQILRSLTTIPARLLGVEKQRGRLAVGMAADLIAVGGDPQNDTMTLSAVQLVVKDGRVVSR